jgi:hypothetical protein
LKKIPNFPKKISDFFPNFLPDFFAKNFAKFFRKSWLTFAIFFAQVDQLFWPDSSSKFFENFDPNFANFDPELAQLRPQNTPWNPPEHPPEPPPEWVLSGTLILRENDAEFLLDFSGIPPSLLHSNPTIFEWPASLGTLDRGEKGWSPFSRKTCYTT